jgi:hypothetical protein
LAGLRDGKSPVYVTEGEKKALALSQLGLAAVGIGGVWCGCKKDTEELISDLTEIRWTGRTVYIVFDFDAKETTRNVVAAAARRLERALRSAGAGRVYAVELPPGPDGGKQGVDDYLFTHDRFYLGQLVGRAEAGNTGKRIITEPELGKDAYHGFVGQFLRAVAPFTEATDAGVLAHLLPALGTLVGPRCCVWAGGKHYPRLNTAVVGPTKTGRKGTSLSPVDALMTRAAPEFWKNRRRNWLASGEGLIEFLQDKEVFDPATKETTPEQTDKRVYVVEGEFSRVLTLMGKDGNVLSQVIREAFDGGDLATMTVKPRTAPGAHVCITGHITPDELSRKLSETEMLNGFGNRFLWFVVRSGKVMSSTSPIPADVFEPFLPRVRALAAVGDHWLFGGEKEIGLSPEAQSMWDGAYRSLREDKPGLAGAMTARGEVMIMRVALLYALLDEVGLDRKVARPFRKKLADEVEDRLGGVVIRPEHLRAGMAVWWYCEESAFKLFARGESDPLRTKVLTLLDAGPKTRDEFNRHLSADQKKGFTELMKQLVAEGLVRETRVQHAGAGRPATRWELSQGSRSSATGNI